MIGPISGEISIAPMMTAGVDIDLPPADAPRMDVDEQKLLLTIDREQRVFLGEDEIPNERLEDVLMHNERLQREREIFVQADQAVPYGVVVRVLAILRRGRSEEEQVLAVCNFTHVPRKNYRVGVPRAGQWREVLNGDAPVYGGSGQGNMGGVVADPVPFHGRPASVSVTLPPLAVVFLAWEGPAA